MFVFKGTLINGQQNVGTAPLGGPWWEMTPRDGMRVAALCRDHVQRADEDIGPYEEAISIRLPLSVGRDDPGAPKTRRAAYAFI